jgi:hypothetical protein
MRGGCRFVVQAVSGKPRRERGKGGHVRLVGPTPESAVATLKLGPGKSALVTLMPKPRFVAKLDAAAKLLVREVETVKEKTKTSYRRMKVIR